MRVLQPDYPLETARLTLRPFVPDDLDDLFDIESRPEVARYLYWQARGLDEVRGALGRKLTQSELSAEGDALSLAVVLRQTGRVIGEATLIWLSRDHRQGEIGYVVHPGHTGKGLATEVAEELLRLGFTELGLHRLIGRCDARNTLSARLLERLGMRREAHFVHNEVFKGQWGEEFVYAMLEDEWKSRSDA